MKKNEILVCYGDDPQAMTMQIAEAAGLASLIGDRSKRIGLKPNLVVSRPASNGATTHPEIAAGLIAYLKKNGFQNIVILEGSWVGDSTSRAFNACGYTSFKKLGVELIDTQTDKAKKYDCAGMELEICTSAMELDFMINLPVLKGHCQTSLTCALKNNKGIIPDREKRRYHSLGIHKPVAHLNTMVRNDFIIVDGICGDPDFEEGGNPVYGGRIFAARDPVLCDAFAANQLGLSVNQVQYIGIAEKLGIGSSDLKKAIVKTLSSPLDSQAKQTGSGGKIRRLAPYINEKEACSACYAALVSALLRISQRELEKFQKPLCIGQGFKGKTGNIGIGIGSCTSGFTHYCVGCPPSGNEILSFLNKNFF